MSNKEERMNRNKSIIEDYKNGKPILEIAREYNLSETMCYKILKGTQEPPRYFEKKRKRLTTRNEQIVKQYKGGMQELDRLPNDVILIGTTNRVDNLDEALIRRFTFKHRVKPLGDDDMKELCKKFLASADYPFTESELDELCHSLREQRTASAVVNACTERIVAHIVSQLPENSADAV